MMEQKSAGNLFGVISALIIVALSASFTGCSQTAEQGDGDLSAISEHVEFLADEELNGRLAGTAGEAASANFIADQFLVSGLQPAGDRGTYLQQFALQGPMPQAMEVENYMSRNVVGFVEGSGRSGQYIFIGAHYDSQ